VDFVAQVVQVLKRHGADPQKLKLEITESLLIADVDDAVAKITALKAHGVSFALDDFGTGYASLNYLKRLPLECLKIDRSFVEDIITDPNDAAIAKTIVAMAQCLGLSVIAEGVETKEQQNLLLGIGCRVYQGYLFSRPLPVEKFEQLVVRETVCQSAELLTALAS
jgi:EAL domain-containing protein (putative c-di-GMP-specific phosphodiesterase class I)